MTAVSLRRLRAAAAWLPVLSLSANAAVTAWLVFYVHPMQSAIYSDMFAYVRRATEIEAGVHDPYHFFQGIGYPLWVAALKHLAGGRWWLLQFSHVVLVTLSVYLGWRVARRLLPGRWDLAALVLMSAQIQWWALASFALSEMLYTFLVTLLLWCTVRWVETASTRFAAAAGMTFAVGFFVKASVAPFPLLLALWTIARLRSNRQALVRGAAQLAVMGCVALAVALAHGSWAYAKYGHFKLGADAGALNFVEGKCPGKRNFDLTGSSYMSPLFYALGETREKRWDASFLDTAYFWREGWKCIRENPLVLITSGRYVFYLFAGNPLWPLEFPRTHAAERAYETAFALVVFPLFALGMAAAMRAWKTALAVPALLYLALFVTVWIFKSELRLRVPFDAITMIYASYGAAIAWRWLAGVARGRARSPASATIERKA